MDTNRITTINVHDPEITEVYDIDLRSCTNVAIGPICLFFDDHDAVEAFFLDGLTKLRSVGAISIEGMWDELGWDEARKRQEKGRLAAEADDPTLTAILDKLSGSTVSG